MSVYDEIISIASSLLSLTINPHTVTQSDTSSHTQHNHETKSNELNINNTNTINNNNNINDTHHIINQSFHSLSHSSLINTRFVMRVRDVMKQNQPTITHTQPPTPSHTTHPIPTSSHIKKETLQAENIPAQWLLNEKLCDVARVLQQGLGCDEVWDDMGCYVCDGYVMYV